MSRLELSCQLLNSHLQIKDCILFNKKWNLSFKLDVLYSIEDRKKQSLSTWCEKNGRFKNDGCLTRITSIRMQLKHERASERGTLIRL